MDTEDIRALEDLATGLHAASSGCEKVAGDFAAAADMLRQNGKLLARTARSLEAALKRVRVDTEHRRVW